MSEEKVVVIDDKTNARNEEDIEKQNEQLEKELSGGKDMSLMLVEKDQDRSLNIGVIGVGQCGNKIAQEFYERGYQTVAINTAVQDLKHIKIPEPKKLFLDYSMGGCGKDLAAGEEAAQQYASEILNHVEKNTDGCEVLMLVTSGGGGTGSGSAETMVDLLNQTGKPVVVLFALPLASEDALAKHNAIQTLSRLSKLAAADQISSLMVVDNAKIEMLYPGQSISTFWKTANSAIVEPLHLFNTLSAQASEHMSLDSQDFASVFLGGDCSLYGMIEVEDYSDEEAIAEAIVVNLENGLLASEFNLSEARTAGVIITGSQKALSEIPTSNIEYGLAMLSKVAGDSVRVFRGIYGLDNHPDTIRVYSFLSGLGLPTEKVKELKAEAEKHMKALEQKESEGARAGNMTIDLGKTSSTSAVDRMHNKIKSKNSALGKLKRGKGKLIDRRRR